MTSTVLLKGDGIHKEAIAAGAITPGHLVMLNNTGKVVVCTGASKKIQPNFALENELIGEGIDTAYASGDKVPYIVPERGAEVYALVPAAAAAIVIGDYLECDGTGCLRKFAGLTDSTGGTANTTLVAISAGYVQAEVANNMADLAAYANANRTSTIAIALEAVDNSAGAAPARIKVEVL